MLKLETAMCELAFAGQVEGLDERLASMKKLIANLFQLVRDVATALRPPILDAGIASAIEWQVRRFEERTQIPCLVEVPEQLPRLADAKAINDFLLRRRSSLTLVPIKERSLEICGDEKRLDNLRTGTSLFKGRLSLKALGAFLVPLPLPYRQANAPGKPVLVVENHNSFWSFGEWNQTALRYSALVYGAGEAFRSTGQALGQVLREVGGDGAEYLGDLDPKGVGIPLEFNRASSTQDLQVRPALDLYQWLLAHGHRREKPECRGATAQMATSPAIEAPREPTVRTSAAATPSG